MKATVRIAFAVLLLSLPRSHAFAQTVPDELTPTDVPQLVEEASTAQPEASASSTPPTALLWQPVVQSRETDSEPAVAAPAPRAWSDWSTQKKALVIGGGVVALMILGIVSIG